MHKVEVEMNNLIGENTYHSILSNGLNVYICKKEGFNKKIGMFGTKYGSVDSEFIDIRTGNRIKVPDGIAHFLEHKLFEKEGSNALDMFSKIGVDSNAYTTFDHTVYYFQTTDKFEESIKLLIKLIKEPYFTDENVKKEQGIIAQEIMMGEDDPNYMVYFNALKAMYKNNNVRVDIAGTTSSIMDITKELLYTCYDTFYNLANMFFVVVGDVDVDSTLNLIDDTLKLYVKSDENKNVAGDVKRFYLDEPKQINQKQIVQKMDIFMPQVCLGYKLNTVKGEEIIKRAIIADIVSKMYFSKLSNFYEVEYNKKILNDEVIISYEGSNTFSHIMVLAESTDVDLLKSDLLEYIEKIKKSEIDEALFNEVKKSKIGTTIMYNDSLSSCYRRIIDAILVDVDIYSDVNSVENITTNDVKEFLQLFDENYMCTSIIDRINK